MQYKDISDKNVSSLEKRTLLKVVYCNYFWGVKGTVRKANAFKWRKAIVAFFATSPLFHYTLPEYLVPPRWRNHNGRPQSPLGYNLLYVKRGLLRAALGFHKTQKELGGRLGVCGTAETKGTRVSLLPAAISSNFNHKKPSAQVQSSAFGVWLLFHIKACISTVTYYSNGDCTFEPLSYQQVSIQEHLRPQRLCRHSSHRWTNFSTRNNG